MKNISFDISSLAKNFNEAIIISTLIDSDRHGYEIALEIEEKSNKEFKLNHGTLYPILHKLEKERLIKGIWQESTTKRKRKYYSITADGRQYFTLQKNAWQNFCVNLQKIIGGKEI